MIRAIIALVFTLGKHVSLLIQIFVYLCVQGGSLFPAFFLSLLVFQSGLLQGHVDGDEDTTLRAAQDAEQNG
jgi:hypothetical protein